MVWKSAEGGEQDLSKSWVRRCWKNIWVKIKIHYASMMEHQNTSRPDILMEKVDSSEPWSHYLL